MSKRHLNLSKNLQILKSQSLAVKKSHLFFGHFQRWNPAERLQWRRILLSQVQELPTESYHFWDCKLLDVGSTNLNGGTIPYSSNVHDRPTDEAQHMWLVVKLRAWRNGLVGLVDTYDAFSIKCIDICINCTHIAKTQIIYVICMLSRRIFQHMRCIKYKIHTVCILAIWFVFYCLHQIFMSQ